MPTDDSKTSTTEATDTQPKWARTAYENARQRDAVIAVMHRLKRATAKGFADYEAHDDEDAGYHLGGATQLGIAIEELREALCLPVDWAGEGDPS